MRFGDVLVVHDLSRLGRNKQEILKVLKLFIQQNQLIVVKIFQ